MVYKISIRLFNMNDRMFFLREKLKIFNLYLNLIENLRQLSSELNRQFKIHESILISLKNAEIAEQAFKHKLRITENIVKVKKYITTGT